MLRELLVRGLVVVVAVIIGLTLIALSACQINQEDRPNVERTYPGSYRGWK